MRVPLKIAIATVSVWIGVHVDPAAAQDFKESNVNSMMMIRKDEGKYSILEGAMKIRFIIMTFIDFIEAGSVSARATLEKAYSSTEVVDKTNAAIVRNFGRLCFQLINLANVSTKSGVHDPANDSSGYGFPEFKCLEDVIRV